MRWFLLVYTLNRSNIKPVKHKICAWIPSRICCNQFKVSSKLVLKFIMRCLVTKVCDTFS